MYKSQPIAPADGKNLLEHLCIGYTRVLCLCPRQSPKDGVSWHHQGSWMNLLPSKGNISVALGIMYQFYMQLFVQGLSKCCRCLHCVFSCSNLTTLTAVMFICYNFREPCRWLWGLAQLSPNATKLSILSLYVDITRGSKHILSAIEKVK